MTPAAVRSPSSLTIGCGRSPSHNHAPFPLPNPPSLTDLPGGHASLRPAAEPCDWLRELACFPTPYSLPSIGEAGGTPRKLSVNLRPPHPPRGPSPGPRALARARPRTHTPPLPVPTSFSSCSCRSPGLLRGRRKGAWGRGSWPPAGVRSDGVSAQGRGGGFPSREMRGRRWQGKAGTAAVAAARRGPAMAAPRKEAPGRAGCTGSAHWGAGRPAGWRPGLKRREARSAPAPPRPRLSCLNFGLPSTRPPRPESTTSSPPSAPALASVSPGSSPRGGDQEPPALRCGREASAGGEEKLGGAGSSREGGVAGGDRAAGRGLCAPRPRLLLLPLPVPRKQQPELPSARAAEMSSSSPPPPAGAASAAISASEKVDGFTRKSVRKAQRQKRSQGSSQFRSQGSQAELHPLPQLKGNLRGRRREGARRQGPRLLGFLLPRRGSSCESCSPRCLGISPVFDSNRSGVESPASSLSSPGFALTRPVSEEASTSSPPARSLTCPWACNSPPASRAGVLPSSRRLALPHLALTNCLTSRPSLSGDPPALFGRSYLVLYFPVIKRLHPPSPPLPFPLIVPKSHPTGNHCKQHLRVTWPLDLFIKKKPKNLTIGVSYFLDR